MIELYLPKNNEVVCLITDEARKFCDAYYSRQKKIKNDYKFSGLNWGLKTDILPENYYNENNGRFYYKPVEFKIKIKNASLLVLSLDKNFKKIVEKIKIKSNIINIFNLLRNQKYYWKIIDLKTKEESEVRSFSTGDYSRVMKVDDVLNVRDFGGANTKHGKRVKQGLVFRGAELVRKTYVVKADLEKNQQSQYHAKSLNKKGLKTLNEILKNGVEIDLRSPKEANNIRKSPASTIFNKVDYYEHVTYAYDEVFTTTDNDIIQWYKKIFEIISNADKKPVYIHCWGGADRTGTICFLLGALLGISYTDLILEYELTSFCGNIRKHNDLKPKYAWLRFPQFVNMFEKYSIENKLSLEYDDIAEHLLINKFKVSVETINRIKKIFLD